MLQTAILIYVYVYPDEAFQISCKIKIDRNRKTRLDTTNKYTLYFSKMLHYPRINERNLYQKLYQKSNSFFFFFRTTGRLHSYTNTCKNFVQIVISNKKKRGRRDNYNHVSSRNETCLSTRLHEWFIRFARVDSRLQVRSSSRIANLLRVKMKSWRTERISFARHDTGHACKRCYSKFERIVPS